MLLAYCLPVLVVFLPTIYAPQAQSQYPWVKGAPQSEKDALHKALDEKAKYSHATTMGDIHASVATGRSPRVGQFLSALDKEIWAGLSRCCNDHAHKEKHSFKMQGIREHTKLECAVCHLHVVYEVSDFSNFVGPDKHVGTFQEVMLTVADMRKNHPDFGKLWDSHSRGIVGMGKLAEDHLPPVNSIGIPIPWEVYEFQGCVREIAKKPQTGLMANAAGKATTLLGYATKFGQLVAMGSAIVLSEVNRVLTKIEEDKEKMTVGGMYVPGSNRRPETNNQPGEARHVPHCFMPEVMNSILEQVLAEMTSMDGMSEDDETHGHGHGRNNESPNAGDDEQMSEASGTWSSRDSDTLPQPKGAAAQTNHLKNMPHERNNHPEIRDTANRRQPYVHDDGERTELP